MLLLFNSPSFSSCELKNYNLAKQGILPDFWNTYSDFNGILDNKISIFTHKGQVIIW